MIDKNLCTMRPDYAKNQSLERACFDSDMPIELGLFVNCILGVNSYERTSPQTIEIKLVFTSNKTVNQANLAEIKTMIRQIVLAQKPYLLERMAFVLASSLCETFSCINELNLTIKKPCALKNAKNAYVTISAQRKSEDRGLLKCLEAFDTNHKLIV